MKKIIYLFTIFFCISVLVGTGISCKKEVFDEEIYDTLIKIMSPVDSVDPNHNWELSTSNYLIVTANVGAKTKQVQILDKNPLSSNDACIIAKADVAEGERAGIYISYPNTCTTLYAAAVDSTGAYTVVGFSPGTNEIDFSNPLFRLQTLSNTSLLQYYAFCYEEEFPEPGDYDFNDVVMHIALEQVSSKLLYVHVRLAAVGASQQLAGAIRLPGLTYEDVDSVWTLNGESFNKDITDQYMVVQLERDPLIKGLNDEAILNLFADAHWATGDILNADFGVFTRKQYNVTKKSSSTAQLMVPREITFVVRSKTADRLSNLTLDNIDPFIIRMYNGARMEVHTYKYRKVMALNQYTYIDTDNLPWALKVPVSGFNHPLHGMNIGFRMRENSAYGILFGAYATYGHAFGEWAMSKSVSTDWYLYPDEDNVFIW